MKPYSLILLLAFAVAAFAVEECASTQEGAGYFRTVPATQHPALDPGFKPILAEWAKARPIETMTLAEARRLTQERFTKLPKLNEPIAQVRDQSASDSGQSVPVRIYTPRGKGPFPILLYIHGGGWTVGSLETHDDLCRSVCHRAGCLVVSVA